jgi:hypothetical protein
VRVAGVETFAENWFFMIKDRDTGVGAASDSDPTRILTPSDLAEVSGNCLQDPSQAASCQPDLSRGWRILLSQGKGEKVLAAPLTAANRIYFTSYLPARSNETTTCGPSEGGGLFYAVNLKDATAVFNYNTSDGGTAASPNSAVDRFDALASAGIPTEVVYINLPDASGAEVKCALGSDLNCRALPGGDAVPDVLVPERIKNYCGTIRKLIFVPASSMVSLALSLTAWMSISLPLTTGRLVPPPWPPTWTM